MREQDGMWAVLAWLQVLACKSKEARKVVTVEDVANVYWREFDYYARCNCRGVDKLEAER